MRRYLAWQVARYFPEAGDYAAKRVAAEETARRERPGDVDLDEIHACFRREAGPGWSEAALLFVEREEVALDARTLRSRPIMLEAMQAARMAAKRIVLTSDSYLARRQFDAMLAPFIGLTDAVYLSSERRARKDDGSLWRLVRDEEGAAPLLHVGDNEHSDIQNTADAGIRHFHVMSPAMLFGLSGLDAGAEPDGERPLGDEILLGPVAAHLFAIALSRQRCRRAGAAARTGGCGHRAVRTADGRLCRLARAASVGAPSRPIILRGAGGLLPEAAVRTQCGRRVAGRICHRRSISIAPVAPSSARCRAAGWMWTRC